MQQILPFFFIFISIIAIANIVSPLLQKAEISSVFVPLPETSKITPQPETPRSQIPQSSRASRYSLKCPSPKNLIPESKPSFSVDTYIVSGPKEGEVITETTKVVFEFSAKTSPETKEAISFETKILGFDEDWIETFSKKRYITLPSGPKEYTFLVRAKIKSKNIIDQTPAKRNFKINVSPYFKKIKISNVRIPSKTSPSLITLQVQFRGKEKINITGWKIKGKRGSFSIPEGIGFWQPYFNPAATENIFVKSGDRVYISNGKNPLGYNRNFRINKCIGYLSNFYDLPIRLPQNCPKPTKEEISNLSECCQRFIQRLRICEIPDYSNSIDIMFDPECISYLNNHFNYQKCFFDHSKDEDFLGNEWHIYINHNIITQTGCDTLYLLDQNGLFVDKYNYGYTHCRI